jgi:hypothetical protein
MFREARRYRRIKKMTQARPFALPPSELNEFLLAEIGTQPNGLVLTVLSLLARAGRDPWNEAERLAMLSRESAIESITVAIAASPVCLVPECNPAIVAARLAARLPQPPQASWSGAAYANAIAVIPPWVGLTVVAISLGAMLLAPFRP